MARLKINNIYKRYHNTLQNYFVFCEYLDNFFLPSYSTNYVKIVCDLLSDQFTVIFVIAAAIHSNWL